MWCGVPSASIRVWDKEGMYVQYVSSAQHKKDGAGWLAGWLSLSSLPFFSFFFFSFTLSLLHSLTPSTASSLHTHPFPLPLADTPSLSSWFSLHLSFRLSSPLRIHSHSSSSLIPFSHPLSPLSLFLSHTHSLYRFLHSSSFSTLPLSLSLSPLLVFFHSPPLTYYHKQQNGIVKETATVLFCVYHSLHADWYRCPGNGVHVAPSIGWRRSPWSRHLPFHRTK